MNSSNQISLLVIFRRKLIFNLIMPVLLAAIPVTVLTLLATELLVLLTSIGSGGFLLIIPAYLLAVIILMLKRCPSLTECAKKFDKEYNCNSRVTNAFELLNRRAGSPFAEYAIAQGLECLEQYIGQPLKPEPVILYWKSTGAMLLVAVSILLVPELWGSKGQNGVKVSEQGTTVSGNSDILRKKSEESRRKNIRESISLSRTLSFMAGTDRNIPRKYSVYGETASGDSKFKSLANGTGGGAENGRQGVRPESKSRQDPAYGAKEKQSAQKQNKTKKSNSKSSGNGGMDGGNDGELSTDSYMSSYALARSDFRRNHRRRHPQKQPQVAGGGSQPLLSDNSPPAGRKLSDKDGEGDRPGDGRGGPTGEKKSRGTAAMLPVNPLPDTVIGRLSPGEDIKKLEQAPAVTEINDTQTGMKYNRKAETVSSENIIPLALRRRMAETFVNKGQNEQ